VRFDPGTATNPFLPAEVRVRGSCAPTSCAPKLAFPAVERLTVRTNHRVKRI